VSSIVEQRMGDNWEMGLLRTFGWILEVRDHQVCILTLVEAGGE